jgi:hypothetical protein
MHNPLVLGSNPSGPTIIRLKDQRSWLMKRWLHHSRVVAFLYKTKKRGLKTALHSYAISSQARR